MFRTFAIAASVTAIALGAAQAETLDARIHTAAVKACAPEASTSTPASYYGAITQTCIYRVSKTAMINMQAKALEKTKSSTAGLSN